MRDKFNQFMQGRYGNDDLNFSFLMKIILAALVPITYLQEESYLWRSIT